MNPNLVNLRRLVLSCSYCSILSDISSMVASLSINPALACDVISSLHLALLVLSAINSLVICSRVESLISSISSCAAVRSFVNCSFFSRSSTFSFSHSSVVFSYWDLVLERSASRLDISSSFFSNPNLVSFVLCFAAFNSFENSCLAFSSCVSKILPFELFVLLMLRSSFLNCSLSFSRGINLDSVALIVRVRFNFSASKSLSLSLNCAFVNSSCLKVWTSFS
mmetsp:Transcript_14350/g.20486  ORF Transcript_14350/g.20486 Transcript_14350/m.20486 type:complete len:223 (-) Transcript_14350:790-1458(-)